MARLKLRTAPSLVLTLLGCASAGDTQTDTIDLDRSVVQPASPSSEGLCRKFGEGRTPLVLACATTHHAARA